MGLELIGIGSKQLGSNNWGQSTINCASQINHDLTPIVQIVSRLCQSAQAFVFGRLLALRLSGAKCLQHHEVGEMA